jgi:LAO/AO transport system kinase
MGEAGDLVCAEAADGEEVWRKNMIKDLGGEAPKWLYCDSPLIDGKQGVRKCGGSKGAVAGLDKADRDGVYSTEKELEALLSLASRDDGWDPPIVKTVATENQGVADLAAAIDTFKQAQHGGEGRGDRRRAIARWRIVELLRENLLARVLESDASVAMLNRLADEVATRQRDPYSAVDELLKHES